MRIEPYKIFLTAFTISSSEPFKLSQHQLLVSTFILNFLFCSLCEICVVVIVVALLQENLGEAIPKPFEKANLHSHSWITSAASKDFFYRQVV